ncbi:MAG: hypothetical protein RDU20_08785 [Desulfomonilaceae bacterium]|nr:hypothetical protein [Desulfomonilaceae bacterium]
MGTSSIESISNDDNIHEEKRLGLNDRLALIDLISEGARRRSADSPIVADLFSELWNLVDATVSGAKIDRLTSGDYRNGFKVLEINAETGENLARLNMLYLNKPIPCYYLVYVEVAAPYRNKGLGNRILKAFRDFLDDKSSVGLLDNIIPQDDPTYDIYRKLDWKPVEEFTGVTPRDAEGLYMAYVPRNLEGREIKDAISKLVYHLKRKRHVIDMRDNELMVRRTIEEFKDLYSALLTYFEERIFSGESDSLMRFMFTRYVTKLLGFKRRISQLLGYTGGESLGQIVLHPEIRALPAQSYAPRDLADQPSFVAGDRELWLHLPEVFKKHPARMIESLPNYRRPRLVAWLEEQGRSSAHTLTIGDLFDMGFDPTRLKEISLQGENFIFERAQARMIPELHKRMDFLHRIESETRGMRVKNARIGTTPPLLIIRDRGNAYVLRRKVEGIHWEEAVDQLQSSPSLRAMNASVKVDKLITTTVRKSSEWVHAHCRPEEEPLLQGLSFFVSWNLEANQPKIVVDFGGSYVESVWVA